MLTLYVDPLPFPRGRRRDCKLQVSGFLIQPPLGDQPLIGGAPKNCLVRMKDTAIAQESSKV